MSLETTQSDTPLYDAALVKSEREHQARIASIQAQGILAVKKQLKPEQKS